MPSEPRRFVILDGVQHEITAQNRTHWKTESGLTLRKAETCVRESWAHLLSPDPRPLTHPKG